MKKLKVDIITKTITTYELTENVFLEVTEEPGLYNKRLYQTVDKEILSFRDVLNLSKVAYPIIFKEDPKELFEIFTANEIISDKTLYYSPEEISEDTQIVRENIYLYVGYTNELFDIEGNIVSCVLVCGTGSTFTDKKDEPFDELIEHLKIHPYVIDVDVVEIPSYNRDFKGQRGFITRFKLPQEIYTEIYNAVRSKNSIVHQCLYYYDFVPGLDPLGIRELEFCKNYKKLYY